MKLLDILKEIKIFNEFENIEEFYNFFKEQPNVLENFLKTDPKYQQYISEYNITTPELTEYGFDGGEVVLEAWVIENEGDVDYDLEFNIHLSLTPFNPMYNEYGGKVKIFNSLIYWYLTLDE